MSGLHQQVFNGLLNRKGRSYGLRMTSMIDVIFLLLTFFVLTAKFQESEQVLCIDAVGSAKVSVNDSVPLKITVERTGSRIVLRVANKPEILLDETQPADALLLLGKKAQESLESSSFDAVELYCADGVPWDIAVKIYDTLYALGLRDITFKTEF